MKNTPFKKTQLATSMALLMGSTLALPSYAQESEAVTPAEGEVEVIVMQDRPREKPGAAQPRE